MKFTAAFAAASAMLAMSAHASIFGFDTFGETSCQGFQEFIHITQQGANSAAFPGPRKSFQVTETDNDCEVILWTGDFNGEKIVFDQGTLAVGTCFGDNAGDAFNSFDVHCFWYDLT